MEMYFSTSSKLRGKKVIQPLKFSSISSFHNAYVMICVISLKEKSHKNYVFIDQWALMRPLNLLVVGLEAMWRKCYGIYSHSVLGGGEGDTCGTFHCNSMSAWTLRRSQRPLLWARTSIYRAISWMVSFEGCFANIIGERKISVEIYLIITL